jgi:pimeloyl-ACP methyl ester carboxylesterase
MAEGNGAASAAGPPPDDGGHGQVGVGAGDGAPGVLAEHISEHTAALGDLPVFWRSAEDASAHATPLYLHGVPASSDDWLPFLVRSGGLAVDLPGFGRSGKPGDRAYTIPEYEDFIEGYLELVGVGRVQLVMHDWGAVGLAFAQRNPERVERLVLIDAVPFLPGYRWHRAARIWRTPAFGELAMGVTTRPVLRLASRAANATPGALPDAWIDSVLEHFDQGTQRAILRLYRSSPPEVLAQAGSRLGRLSLPALVLWGALDPYIPVRFAHDYARAIAGAELDVVDDAGHYPWLDRPQVIDRVVAFLEGA